MNEIERLARAAYDALRANAVERKRRDPTRNTFPIFWENAPQDMRDDFELMARAVVQELARGYHLGDVQQKALIFDRIVAWSRATFPRSTLQSTFEHLKREMDELEKNPANPGEQADITHLIVQLAHLSGHDHMAELEKKFAENQARTWQEPDAQGVVEHVRNLRDQMTPMEYVKRELEGEWPDSDVVEHVRASAPETFMPQQAVERLIKEIESTEGKVHSWEATLDYIGERPRRLTLRIWTQKFVRDYWYNAADNTWHYDE